MRANWIIRTGIGCGLMVAGWGGSPSAEGQVGKASKDNAPTKAESKEIVLNVSRQKLPDPLFKYRLLPFPSELNPGNASPVYLRLDKETSSDSIHNLYKRASELAIQPLAHFPREEARKMVEDFAGKIRSLQFGTRRRFCDWDYTIEEEKESPFELLLGDAQSMRPWGHLLAVKARLEIASGQADQAIQTLETGIAFSQHVGEGPFYVNKLVGIAILSGLLNQLDELIGQPETPNLYWALTALPAPLVKMRDAVATERVSLGRAFTGQKLDEFDLGTPRSDTEWSAILADLHSRMIRMEKLVANDPKVPTITPANLEVYKSTMLPRAHDYLRDHHLTAKGDDQALVISLISLYRNLADENFKVAYITYPAGIEEQLRIRERTKAAELGLAATFARFLPDTWSALTGEVRVTRKIAALQVVEALRLYAADHEDALPTSLDQIEAVPVPPDPVTGQPFRYRLDGKAAVLEETKPLSGPGLIYRITIRP